MATVADVVAAVQTLDGLVDQLVAAAQAEDLQPAVDAVNAVVAKVDGFLNPPATEPAPEG